MPSELFLQFMIDKIIPQSPWNIFQCYLCTLQQWLQWLQLIASVLQMQFSCTISEFCMPWMKFVGHINLPKPQWERPCALLQCNLFILQKQLTMLTINDKCHSDSIFCACYKDKISEFCMQPISICQNPNEWDLVHSISLCCLFIKCHLSFFHEGLFGELWREFFKWVQAQQPSLSSQIPHLLLSEW